MKREDLGMYFDGKAVGEAADKMNREQPVKRHGERQKVEACPRCGSTGIGWDGLGKPTKWVCALCRLARGNPHA